jgi:membrane protein
MDPYYAGRAAEIAFYLLLSLVPTAILLAHFLNVFSISMKLIRDILQNYLSPEIIQGLSPFLNYNSNNAISFALIILAVWSGSKALFSMMRITNYAYLGDKYMSGKNPINYYIRERIRAILTIIIIIATLAFAMYALVYGKIISKAITEYMHSILGKDFEVAGVIFTIRWIVAFLLYFFMVSSIYYLLPTNFHKYSMLFDKKRKTNSIFVITKTWWKNSTNTYKQILPGSFFSAIGMLLVTAIYSNYMSYIASLRFNILYGSLSSLVALMLWFYFLSLVLIIGIQINAARNKMEK